MIKKKMVESFQEGLKRHSDALEVVQELLPVLSDWDKHKPDRKTLNEVFEGHARLENMDFAELSRTLREIHITLSLANSYALQRQIMPHGIRSDDVKALWDMQELALEHVSEISTIFELWQAEPDVWDYEIAKGEGDAWYPFNGYDFVNLPEVIGDIQKRITLSGYRKIHGGRLTQKAKPRKKRDLHDPTGGIPTSNLPDPYNFDF